MAFKKSLTRKDENYWGRSLVRAEKSHGSEAAAPQWWIGSRKYGGDASFTSCGILTQIRSAYPVLRIAHWISLRGINYVRISTDTTFSPTQFESLFQYMHEKKMHVIFKKPLVRLRCIECLASLQAGEHRVWRWDNDLISLCYSVFVCQLGKTPVHLAGLLRRVLGGGPGTWWDPVTGNCRVLKVGYIRGRMRILEFFKKIKTVMTISVMPLILMICIDIKR